MMYQNVNNILLGLIIMANRGEVMDMTVEELRNFYGRFWEDNYDFIHNARSNFVTWSLRPNNSDLISVSNGITDKAPYYQGNVLWRFLSSMIWGYEDIRRNNETGYHPYRYIDLDAFVLDFTSTTFGGTRFGKDISKSLTIHDVYNMIRKLIPQLTNYQVDTLEPENHYVREFLGYETKRLCIA